MTSQCGTTGGYWAHRAAGDPYCASCRAAMTAYQARYRRAAYLARGSLMVDAVGTARRLRALVRNGWTLTAIAARMGVSVALVDRWAQNKTGHVYRATAVRVAALYDELWDVPGGSSRAASRAMRRGWPPPMAWDDDGPSNIDDPAARPADARGWRRQYRDIDREEQVMHLTRAGLSALEIAVRLGTNKRQVVRIRSRNRQEDVA